MRNNADWSRQTLSRGLYGGADSQERPKSSISLSRRQVKSRAVSERLGFGIALGVCRAMHRRMAIERQERGEGSPEPIERIEYEYCGANYDKYMENLS